MLDPAVAELLTLEGIANALYDLRERVQMGGNRDQISAWNLEKQLLMDGFGAIRRELREAAVSHDLSEKLAEILRLTKTQAGGATTSFANPAPLPSAEGAEPH